MILFFILLLKAFCINGWSVDPLMKDSLVYGIDISHHQGIIRWKDVKGWEGHQIQFIYLKATEGATYLDHYYTMNVDGAKANNFKIGSYHYFKKSSTAKEQFQNFQHAVDKSKQDLIPVVDVEEINKYFIGEFHRNLKEFLDLVESYFGIKPIIYSPNAFYNRHLKHRYPDYKYMVARYRGKKPVLFDKNHWDIWQFSDEGKVAGISAPVDLNILHSAVQLRSLFLPDSSEK